LHVEPPGRIRDIEPEVRQYNRVSGEIRGGHLREAAKQEELWALLTIKPESTTPDTTARRTETGPIPGAKGNKNGDSAIATTIGHVLLILLILLALSTTVWMLVWLLWC